MVYVEEHIQGKEVLGRHLSTLKFGKVRILDLRSSKLRMSARLESRQEPKTSQPMETQTRNLGNHQ